MAYALPNKYLQNRKIPASKWYEYSRRLLSETQKGRIFSQQTKDKMRASAIKRYSSQEQRAKVSGWTKNPTDSTRQKIGNAARNRSIESIVKMKRAKSKPCTIDGINIYPSKKELAANLGWGKNGAGSKFFRYVELYESNEKV